MGRPFLAALAVVALLGVVGVGAITIVSRDTRSSSMVAPAPPASPEPTQAPEPVLPAAAVADGGVLGRPPPAPPPVEQATARAPEPVQPPPESWDSVAPVGRPAALGAIGPALMAGLRGAGPTLRRCFDEVTESRFAATGKTPTTASAAGGENRGPPVLMLELETLDGAVRIVDAPVEVRGAAGEGVILCAQSALRGMTIDVPQARPGARHRMRYTLMR